MTKKIIMIDTTQVSSTETTAALANEIKKHNFKLFADKTHRTPFSCAQEANQDKNDFHFSPPSPKA